MKSLSFSGYVVCGTVVRVVAAVVVSIAHGPVPGHFPLYINQQNTRAVGVDFSVQRKCPHLQPDTLFSVLFSGQESCSLCHWALTHADPSAEINLLPSVI